MAFKKYICFIYLNIAAFLIIIKYNFSFREEYKQFRPIGIFVNWIGLFILIFAILVLYLVANPRFKRLTEVEVDKYKRDQAQEMQELEMSIKDNC